MDVIKNRFYLVLLFILLQFPVFVLPARAQMGGNGDMGGGMMGDLISGRNGGNSSQGNVSRTRFTPMAGWSMMMSPDDREGMSMGMNAGPFINENTVYTLSPDKASLQESANEGFKLDWKLSAYNLNGGKLWDVTLESDMLSAPVFTADSKILLTGRQGMGNMFAWSSGQNGSADPSSATPFSSNLFIVTPDASGASVKNVKMEGEWASRPVPVNSGNNYTIYLTSKTLNVSDWNAATRPMGNPQQNATTHQFLYAFDPNGDQKLKVELQ